MTEPLPLYILSETRPISEQLEILRAAKAQSGVTEKCKPARAFPGCGRLLVFGEESPPFACDWANTSWDDPKLSNKIAWVLTGEGGRPHTVEQWLSEKLGVQVKEVA